MNDILKQRLVGALILVALGVVFWPIIFVEPGDIARDEARRIPGRPAVDTTPISTPDKKGLRESVKLDSRKELQRQQQAIDNALSMKNWEEFANARFVTKVILGISAAFSPNPTNPPFY